MGTTVLCAGIEGMMGSEFRVLSHNLDSVRIIGLPHRSLDICSPQEVRTQIREIRPNYLINCAGYRNVDQAETDREVVHSVNAEGPQNLAKICAEEGVVLVHYGTHGIFDGEKLGPYFESDAPSPLNHYAKTKLAGEEAIASIMPKDRYLIIRISWPYSIQSNNFIGAILRLALRRSEIPVVNDEFGVPNPAGLLVLKTLAMLEKERGLVHLSCEGTCSRYELITYLFEKLGLTCRAIPTPSSAFPALAKRPKNIAIATEFSSLRQSLAMPHWTEAMDRFLTENSEAWLDQARTGS